MAFNSTLVRVPRVRPGSLATLNSVCVGNRTRDRPRNIADRHRLEFDTYAISVFHVVIYISKKCSFSLCLFEVKSQLIKNEDDFYLDADVEGALDGAYSNLYIAENVCIV